MSKILLPSHKNNRSEFVDELDSVQFVLQDNKIPIYPYMGRYFAAIGQGRSLVQGQIAINFISEGYLYAVLDNITSSATSSNPQQDELNQLVAAQSNPGQSVLGVSTPTDPTVQARIQALTASLGTSGLDTAKSYAKKVQLGSIATTANFPNPVYQGGPFDIEIDFTAGGRTVIRRLESCFLVSRSGRSQKTSRAREGRRPRLEGRAGSQRRPEWTGEGLAGDPAGASGRTNRPSNSTYKNRPPKGLFGHVPTMFMEVTGHFYPYGGSPARPNSIGRMHGRLGI